MFSRRETSDGAAVNRAGASCGGDRANRRGDGRAGRRSAATGDRKGHAVAAYEKRCGRTQRCGRKSRRGRETEGVLSFAQQAQSGALSLSGGGIRSATFCLGVIQALAAYDVAPAPAEGEEKSPSLPENSLLGRFQ